MSRWGFSSPHENGLKGALGTRFVALENGLFTLWILENIKFMVNRVYIYIYFLLFKKTNYIHLLILI
jgi:hypothetical protein